MTHPAPPIGSPLLRLINFVGDAWECGMRNTTTTWGLLGDLYVRMCALSIMTITTQATPILIWVHPHPRGEHGH